MWWGGIQENVGEGIFLNSFSSSKRGIAVLIKDEAPITELEWTNFIPENFTKLSLVIKDVKVLIKCIYTPNKDSNPNDIQNESTVFLKTIMDKTGEDILHISSPLETTM